MIVFCGCEWCDQILDFYFYSIKLQNVRGKLRIDNSLPGVESTCCKTVFLRYWAY